MADQREPNSATPAISDAAWADYRRMLSDENFKAEYPERYAALALSVQQASAVTGRQIAPPPPAIPTPAEHHAAKWGVPVAPKAADYNVDARALVLPEGTDPATVAENAKTVAATLAVPPYMAPIIVEALTAGPVDPEKVAAAVNRLGHDYARMVAAVDGLIGGRVKLAAKDLPANALVQLGIFAAHHARMIASKR